MTSERDDDVLLGEITLRLEIDHQYVVGISAGQDLEVDRVRRLGRKAARALGWKVRTNVSRTVPGLVYVVVIVVESSREDRTRLQERTDLITRRSAPQHAPLRRH